MSTLRRLLRLLIWLLVLSFVALLVHNCGGFGVIVAQGKQYDYHIPRRFDASGSWSLYGPLEGLAGLDSGDKEAYLRLSSKRLDWPGLGKDREMRWLLYWGNRRGFRDAARNLALFDITNPHVRRAVQRVGSFYLTQYKLGDTRDDMYLSFDPETARGGWQAGDYYVTVTLMPPFKVGDEVIVPPGGCSLKTYRDGVYIEASFTGMEWCTPEQFPRLYREVTALLNSWRVDK